MKRNLLFAVFALLVGVISGISVYCFHYFYPERYEKTESGEYVNIETAAKRTAFPIDEVTSFVIEYYYPEEGRLLSEHVDEIPMLLGCDKDGVEQYLSNYMKHLSKKEQDEGLTSYELTEYSDTQITLRKTYRKEEKNGFYARSFNGTIVILQSDDKTVYEYTQIMIHTLPEEMQEKINAGYYIENEEDLYSFLENYSS
ncbi:MAG: hypothetical protein K2L07_12780 [Lachnospiraceae bacterium]|nr:hypothetical protein [Lachnospiraceae bacterium]